LAVHFAGEHGRRARARGVGAARSRRSSPATWSSSHRARNTGTAPLSKALVETLDCPDFDVSIGIEDVRPADWVERVYEPDILGKPDTMYKQPGYAPLK
jgi:4-oxalocrotonate tautomerase